MEIPIEESNIALYDSDVADKVRMEAAQCEAQFEGAGENEGVEMWRVVDFKVQKQDEEEMGKFYDGDSYIVLNTFKADPDSEKFNFNVHFWLGANTTQDESGTAAYKTVELDTVLGDVPVQYREVQDYESEEFLDLWKPAMIVMSGGADSGFEKVEPVDYQPRLLHIKGKRNKMRCQAVPVELDSLNDGDVFILDKGLEIFQWNGTSAGIFEKRRAMEVSEFLKQQRHGKAEFQVLDGDEECDSFWEVFGGQAEVKSAEEGGCDTQVNEPGPSKLFRISDSDGEIEVDLEKEGELSKDDLDTNDVFLVDAGGLALFIWVGDGASLEEKANAFQIANKYIALNELPHTVPVSRVTESNTSKAFDALMDN